jgi:hypothetical protein
MPETAGGRGRIKNTTDRGHTARDRAMICHGVSLRERRPEMNRPAARPK